MNTKHCLEQKLHKKTVFLPFAGAIYTLLQYQYKTMQQKSTKCLQKYFHIFTFNIGQLPTPKNSSESVTFRLNPSESVRVKPRQNSEFWIIGQIQSVSQRAAAFLAARSWQETTSFKSKQITLKVGKSV